MKKFLKTFSKRVLFATLIVCVFSVLCLGAFASVIDDYDMSDFETSLNKVFTSAILGKDWDEVVLEYFDVQYEAMSGNYWNATVNDDYPMYGSDGLFSDYYFGEYERKYNGYYMVPPFDWDEYVIYANARRSSELNGTSLDSDSYLKTNTVSPVKVTGEYLKSAAADYNSRYMPMPKPDEYIWSYQSASVTDRGGASDKYEFYPEVPAYTYTAGQWGNMGWSDLYILPFLHDDDDTHGTYFCEYFYRLRSVNDSGTVKFFVDFYKLSDGQLYYTHYGTWYISDYPYWGFRLGSGNIYYRFYKSYTDYLTHSSYRSCGSTSSYYRMISSDNSITYNTPTNLLSASTFTPDKDTHDDWGCYVSNKPFELFANQTSINWQRIPDNYNITIEGDNIYEYNITNPSTGDTSTINEFIEHNYSFNINIDNPSDDDNGGGGSVSGNVTVSGKVDVNGEISIKADPIEIKTDPIDININVNSGSGNFGSLDDPTTIKPVDLSGYLDTLPEQTETMNDYLRTFFSFVPPEFLALLISGIGIAILCRVMGR